MEELCYKLKSVRLSGMTHKLNIRLQEAKANKLSYLKLLNNLIEDELANPAGATVGSQTETSEIPFYENHCRYRHYPVPLNSGSLENHRSGLLLFTVRLPKQRG
ncbi:hypothetical protein GWO43_01025 [candidate division KSB1 bacterium]|nr:hypothetical protein [candidate division KSB1 bacterium]NIV68558.1 hypothetical protein [Phycisphaerae bacterium]NIR69113.1 hypothetical protein [candidate division KSB1 bacterium]NIS22644.1 hypothetical protein [candidate division KSB1 bacterium]NIT69502.1 hypothetical protein [candidate division KSB1 bacterium]